MTASESGNVKFEPSQASIAGCRYRSVITSRWAACISRVSPARDRADFNAALIEHWRMASYVVSLSRGNARVMMSTFAFGLRARYASMTWKRDPERCVNWLMPYEMPAPSSNTATDV
jgi:hypothetical protein